MALESVSKGPKLDSSEDNGLYDKFKKWKCKASFLADRMKLKKKSNDIIIHCVKAWHEETGMSHIDNARLSDEDSRKLNKVLESQCKLHIKIVAALEHKQLTQGDLTLPQYIEKCKLVTKACNFGEAEDKCLRSTILLGPSKYKVYENASKGDTLTSMDVIKIVTEVATAFQNSIRSSKAHSLQQFWV